MTDAFVYAAAIVLGPAPAALIAGTDAFVATSRHTRRLVSSLSSLSTMAISVWIAGFAYHESLGWFVAADGKVELKTMLPPLMLMAVSHYVVNSAIVATLTALARRTPLLRTWRENYLWTIQGFLSGAAAAGLAVALARQIGTVAVLVAIGIVISTYLTYRIALGRVEEKNRRIEEMSQIHLRALESLAMAIDARGHSSFGHLRRTQAYALGIAEFANVDEETREALRTAALLHDVGLLAIPDYILHRPGKLTDEEKRELETYPRIGASILENVGFPPLVIPAIRHHKERWDGRGHPDGLAGDAIPIAARILGLADSIDAARHGRPHRDAKSQDAVIDDLRGNRGTIYDPTLVDLVATHFAELERRALTAHVPDFGGMHEIASSHRELAQPLNETEREQALGRISAVRVEGATLTTLAQGLAGSLTVSQVAAELLTSVVSVAESKNGAVYRRDPASGRFVPIHAEGPERMQIGVVHLLDLEKHIVAAPEGVIPEPIATCDLALLGGSDGFAKLPPYVAFAPIVDSKQVIGAIALFATRRESLTEDDRRLLHIIAQRGAPAIARAQTYEHTEASSLRDALTGLWNSRYLLSDGRRRVTEAAASGAPFAIAVIDLDRFKPVNDQYGHGVGDQVLRHIGTVLSETQGDETIACRWGGDEFVVILIGEAATRAPSLYRSLQARLDTELVLKIQEAETAISIGASLGFASSPGDGSEFDKLVALADERMYANKAERSPPRRPLAAR
ncbi:MAG: diguanylate cyclase [Acidobacteria bacterium]|nr:diguanylate cyclase [Acidobacteriota bacterium]